MIREVLEEELIAQRQAKLKEAAGSASNSVVYITYLNYDGEYGVWNVATNKHAAIKYFNNTAIDELENAPFDPEYGKLYLIEVAVTNEEYLALKANNREAETLLKKFAKDSSTKILQSYND
jgi:hypothetical protein